MADEDSILRRQIEYYRARASEYDDWYYRKGRYDRGDEHRKLWLSELGEIQTALSSVYEGGAVLELACGTGLWTRHLVEKCDRIVAVDAAHEALEINRERSGDRRVEYVRADLFSWHPNEQFDFIFFAFWLSHVPLSRFDEFWGMVNGALGANGKVFFVDSLLTQEATAVNHDTMDRSGRSMRKLDDGREFEIVKVFHEPPRLAEDLQNLGWEGNIHATRKHFYYGAYHRKG